MGFQEKIYRAGIIGCLLLGMAACEDCDDVTSQARSFDNEWARFAYTPNDTLRMVHDRKDTVIFIGSPIRDTVIRYNRPSYGCEVNFIDAARYLRFRTLNDTARFDFIIQHERNFTIYGVAYKGRHYKVPDFNLDGARQDSFTVQGLIYPAVFRMQDDAGRVSLLSFPEGIVAIAPDRQDTYELIP